MLKSLSTGLLAITLLAAPALAGPSVVKTGVKTETSASVQPVPQVKLTPKVANAIAMHRGRHHARRHHMHRRHHMSRHHR